MMESPSTILRSPVVVESMFSKTLDWWKNLKYVHCWIFYKLLGLERNNVGRQDKNHDTSKAEVSPPFSGVSTSDLIRPRRSAKPNVHQEVKNLTAFLISLDTRISALTNTVQWQRNTHQVYEVGLADRLARRMSMIQTPLKGFRNFTAETLRGYERNNVDRKE